MTSLEDSESYLDPSLPIEERVVDLLDRMTLEEKIGQLAGSYIGVLADGPRGVDNVIDEIDEYHIGAAAPFGWGGSPNESTEEATDAARRLQKHALESTRLGVPLLFAADAIHGHAYIKESTVFPNNLGAAATWSPDLVERAAEITATEMRATGAAQNYSPTCDVVRDPRWGRTGETFGESPFLVGALASSEIRGYQGSGPGDAVLATAKHFPAYGSPTRGEDAAPVDVSPSTLRQMLLPPFEAVLNEDVGAVMPCYNSIDGEPAHGSRRYLTDLLREELNFNGIVVSDWNGITQLYEDHRTAGTPIEAARQTRLAGLDIGSVAGGEHAQHIRDLVEQGAVSEQVIEDSAERVLRAKFALGLFEDPYPDPDAEDVLGAPAHLDTAREAVRKSLTLLQNEEDVLPLDDSVDEVFVTGPNADEIVHQNGGWSCNADTGVPGTTILEGISDTVDTDTVVTHEPGSGISTPGDVDAAAERAAEADIAVVALGEDWYLHEFGPSAETEGETGEFPTRNELSLPDAQRDLVAAVSATGTPIVAVLVTGRPLAVEWLAAEVPAILMAYYPGRVGGEVIAETLFGNAEPGGRLPISIPRSAETLPTYFNHLPHPQPIGADEHPASYDPLFEFGHGLSYTTIEYESVDVSRDAVRPDEELTVRATVANTGDRHGSEVVQVFGRDEFSSVVTPVRELWAFERVELDPGERAEVELRISADEIGRFERSRGERIQEGRLRLFVADRTFDLDVR
ncbi:glycoside hydrolase family 3 N-terminal domain-containing protein [Natrialba taiwanensis]|uniref:beta-glucosidase n=1 Tax=Natrialba taiwanensis DSM 12281 TaxID=1230458 RepID=M0ADG1_9EURY|nr:glycoside hydrolase family 3 N-terminal domain-containing protein [Natrialba taiwanensis]ELY96795.1 beta-glucosidase [Natrialba taiwanensis DSM 12281]